MSWFVYLVKCVDGSYYCGVTTDLQRRLAQHNGTRLGGAKYTRSHRPVRYVYFIKCAQRGAALRREARIKALSHDRKSRYDCELYTKQGKFLGVIRPDEYSKRNARPRH